MAQQAANSNMAAAAAERVALAQREYDEQERIRREQDGNRNLSFIEQEIRAGRMKRCPHCGTGIEKMLGCDHMHCRGAGGCGSHFCFVCEAMPTNQQNCRGRGRNHMSLF